MTLNTKAANHKDRICLALDLHNENQILQAVDQFMDLVGYFKLNSAFTLFGPDLVQKIRSRGAKVFLDLKLHDIPNTLSGYGEAVVLLGIQIVTVHISGGSEMLIEFVRSVNAASVKFGIPRPKLIGITVLTSIGETVLNNQLGIRGSVAEEVLRKAQLAADAGLDGIVSSVGELGIVKRSLRSDFFYVTPGVRPNGAAHDDHQRVYTYEDAAREGSDLLVVGRSVLNAKNPRAAMAEIHQALGISK